MSSTDSRPRLHARSRWSHAAKCPRMGAYGLLGADPDDPDDRTRRLRLRGHQLGDYVAEVFEAKYPGQVIREKEVPWPAGILHTDIAIMSERTAVEVKSSASPPSVLADAIIQCAGEVHFDPDVDHGLVAVVNPVDLWIDYTPVVLDDDLVALVEDIAAQVVKAGATHGKVLPDRACRKPSDAQGRFCPFAGQCFDGWERPELPVLEDARVETLARQFHEIDRVLRGLKGNRADLSFAAEALNEWGMDAAIERLAQSRTVNAAEMLLKRVKAELAEAIGEAPQDFLRDPGEYEVGPYVLSRTHVVRKAHEVKASEFDKWGVRLAEGAEPLLSGGDFEAGENFDFGDEAPF